MNKPPETLDELLHCLCICVEKIYSYTYIQAMDVVQQALEMVDDPDSDVIYTDDLCETLYALMGDDDDDERIEGSEEDDGWTEED